VTRDYIDDVFASDGLIAQAVGSAYEMRQGQIDLARAVDRSIVGRRVLVGEAMTGVGKSRAYLVPAIVHAAERNLRTVVSTKTKLLQDQLAERELPFLASRLPWRFSFVVRKGRANYLCFARMHFSREERDSESWVEGRRSEDLKTIESWARLTQDGDRARLPFEPSARLWGMFECRGECEKTIFDENKKVVFGVCHAMRVQEAAAKANLVIVNHAFLMCHVAHSRRILDRDRECCPRCGEVQEWRPFGGMTCPVHGSDRRPPFDVLIVDEAHDFVDVAREKLGLRATESKLALIAKRTRGGWVNTERFPIARRCDDLEVEASKIFAAARAGADGDGSLMIRPGILPSIDGLVDAAFCVSLLLEEAIDDQKVRDDELTNAEDVAAEAGSTPDGAEESEADPGTDPAALYRSLERWTTDAMRIVKADDPDLVCFAELPRGRGGAFRALKIDVSPIIEQFLNEVPSAVFVSATMRTPSDDGPVDFSFFRSEVGPPPDRTDEIVVSSPFDLNSQMMLVVPEGIGGEDLPDDPAWFERDEKQRGEEGKQRIAALRDVEAAAIRAAMDAAGGRTLILCNSHAAVDELHDRLKKKLPYSLLKQNDAPVKILVDRFRSDETSCLIGTRSFEAGVDVPGDALMVLVIHRLPHPHPKDPVLCALIERDVEALVEAGMDRQKAGYPAWARHALPRCVIRLRQMSGRLIRTRTDVGVVLCTDLRLVKKQYGRGMIASMFGADSIAICDDIAAIAPYLDWAKGQVRISVAV
jgi:ATP-dependent DNA helicase DinG